MRQSYLGIGDDFLPPGFDPALAQDIYQHVLLFRRELQGRIDGLVQGYGVHGPEVLLENEFSPF